MHDPMTVAFEIKLPFYYTYEICGHKNKMWYTLITIWHNDPCTDGTDDSCDWWGRFRKLSEKEKAILDAAWNLETILDNRPFFPDHPAHLQFQELKKALREWQRRSRWRIPVRWHFWHWSFQIHPLQKIKRYLFEKCSKCGKGYSWNYCPMSSWSGESSWHVDCENPTHDITHALQNTKIIT